MILIGITITLNQFGIILDGTSAAWAKVSQIILETKTISFNVAIGKGPSVFCTASQKKIKQKLPLGIEAIFDYDKKKIFVLNPNDRTVMSIELSGLPILPSNLFVDFKSAIELLKEYMNTLVNRFSVPENLIFVDIEKNRIELAIWILEDICNDLKYNCFKVEEYPTADRLEVERMKL